MPDVQPKELSGVFQANIRARRLELKLSQDEVAARINRRRKRGKPKVWAPYISALESGDRVPILTTLAELADALETTPDALLSPPEKISA